MTNQEFDALMDAMLKHLGPLSECGEVTVKHDGSVVRTKISPEEFICGIRADRENSND